MRLYNFHRVDGLSKGVVTNQAHARPCNTIRSVVDQQPGSEARIQRCLGYRAFRIGRLSVNDKQPPLYRLPLTTPSTNSLFFPISIRSISLYL